jgi:hypothetical protein
MLETNEHVWSRLTPHVLIQHMPDEMKIGNGKHHKY